MLEMLDVGTPEGRNITSDLGVRTVPAMIIDSELHSLGTSTRAEALAMLSPPTRRAGRRSFE